MLRLDTGILHEGWWVGLNSVTLKNRFESDGSADPSGREERGGVRVELGPLTAWRYELEAVGCLVAKTLGSSSLSGAKSAKPLASTGMLPVVLNNDS